MTNENSGPDFKAKQPWPFFAVLLAVVLFALYVPMFTREDVQLPEAEPLLAAEPVLPDNIWKFCGKVANTRRLCAIRKVDCRSLNREQFRYLLAAAGLCETAPVKITTGDAARLLQDFNEGALCCFR